MPLSFDVDFFEKLCYSYSKKRGGFMGKICCFTGHRDIPDEFSLAIFKNLEAIITDLIEREGVTDFRAGGAMGFDGIAAITVLKLKIKYPHIKLHLILPHKNQEAKFPALDKEIYRLSLTEADSVMYIQERYSSTVMRVRNRALVDGSDFCVYYLDHIKSGTHYTVSYARDHQVKTIDVLKYKKTG